MTGAAGRLVGHAVDDVVDGDAVGERGGALGVIGAIGPLPGVTDVAIVGDGDHDAALIVADGAPFGYLHIGQIRTPVSLDKARAGNLEAIVEIVHGVEDFV